MTSKELHDLRNMLKGSLIRVTQISLSIHKEQERLEDAIAVIDAAILNKGESND
jgi:hypothetical protein